eukprot:1190465-Prorocentrum_minimum.AAC.1
MVYGSRMSVSSPTNRCIVTDVLYWDDERSAARAYDRGAYEQGLFHRLNFGRCTLVGMAAAPLCPPPQRDSPAHLHTPPRGQPAMPLTPTPDAPEAAGALLALVGAEGEAGGEGDPTGEGGQEGGG